MMKLWGFELNGNFKLIFLSLNNIFTLFYLNFEDRNIYKLKTLGIKMKNNFSQNIENYKEKVKKAKEVVEGLNLEEPYKTNSFNTLLKSF